MPVTELDAASIYGSSAQRAARLIHLFKARFQSHERDHVNRLAQYVTGKGAIIDAGAHFGYFTKEFARLNAGRRKVHAFEPLPYNFGILHSVSSGLDNVSIYRQALSDANGSADLLVPVKAQGKIGPGLAHFGKERHRDYIRHRVETVTLDSFVRKAGITEVALIKIDVEGAELLVLRGAREVLGKSGPAIYLELNAAFTERLGYRPPDLFAMLNRYGYQSFLVKGRIDGLSRVYDYTVPGDYLFLRGA